MILPLGSPMDDDNRTSDDASDGCPLGFGSSPKTPSARSSERVIAIATARRPETADSVWADGPDGFWLPEDPDLARLARNWTGLPDAIRKAIIALERSTAAESAAGS